MRPTQSRRKSPRIQQLDPVNYRRVHFEGITSDHSSERRMSLTNTADVQQQSRQSNQPPQPQQQPGVQGQQQANPQQLGAQQQPPAPAQVQVHAGNQGTSGGGNQENNLGGTGGGVAAGNVVHGGNIQAGGNTGGNPVGGNPGGGAGNPGGGGPGQPGGAGNPGGGGPGQPGGGGGNPGGGGGNPGGNPLQGQGGANAIRFALTPGQIPSGIIDYSTKQGMKLFEKAIEALPKKYDGSADNLALFLSQLERKSTNCGWNNGQANEDIVNLPLDITRPMVRRNLIQEHAQFTVEGVTTWASATILAIQDKRAQNNYNMITCMKNSLDDDVQDMMDSEYMSYTVNGVEVAALYLIALIKHAEPGTHATVALVRNDLTNLDSKMLELDSNIEEFNQYVRKQKKRLTNRREHTNDLLINLFKAYSVAQDERFVTSIGNMEEDYLLGKSPGLTDEMLMADAYAAYRVRVERGIWGALNREQETMVAIQAQIDKLKDGRLKVNTKTKTTKTKRKKEVEKDSKKKKSKKETSRPGWKDKNPDGKATLTKNNKTYYWCKYHNQGKGMWVVHKPSECRNKPSGDDDESNEQGDGSSEVNRALVTIQESEGEDDEDSGSESD